MLDIAAGIIIASFVLSLFWGGVRLLIKDELKWLALKGEIMAFFMIISSIGLAAWLIFR